MLAKGKIRLTMNHPYFAMTALKMQYVADESVGTMSIGVDTIRYAPSFVNGIKVDEVEAVLAHEVLHYLLSHITRGVGKNHDYWNQACDFVVNAILKKANFRLPAGHLYDAAYEGMDAEEVYKKIYKDNKDKDQQPKDSDDKGDGEKENSKDPQNWGKMDFPKPEDVQEAEAQIKADAQSAMESGKKAGKGITEALTAVLKDIVEPKQNWREIFHKRMSEFAQNDYTWTKPNRKFIQSGIYLPKLESIQMGRVVWGIDTSISVNEMLLTEFGAEVKDASFVLGVPFTVIHCDYKIRHVEELDQDTDFTPIGRGGTAFAPVFDYVNDEIPETKLLIYLTDGYCNDKLEEPDYEVLWVIYNNKRFIAPFGEVIFV